VISDSRVQVMHSGPSPVYHRDIRQQNILKKRDIDDWFLIDWSDASTTPTCGVTHLTESEHSLRVREDNHGAEVDIWGVGNYLEGLVSRNRCEDAYNVKEMAKRWMADHTITAEAALNEMNVCTSSIDDILLMVPIEIPTLLLFTCSLI
jgi:hypothetical protein